MEGERQIGREAVGKRERKNKGKTRNRKKSKAKRKQKKIFKRNKPKGEDIKREGERQFANPKLNLFGSGSSTKLKI